MVLYFLIQEKAHTNYGDDIIYLTYNLVFDEYRTILKETGFIICQMSETEGVGSVRTGKKILFCVVNLYYIMFS